MGLIMKYNTNMKNNYLFSAIFLAMICSTFSVASALSATEHKFKMTGKAKLNYWFWDIYEISHHAHQKEKIQLLKLKYLRDVEKKYSEEGWEVGLKPLENKEVIKWFKNISPSMKEGDTLEIIKQHPNITIIKHNDKTIAKSNKNDIFQAAHYPWIGKEPIDKKLKNKLLGKN